MPLQQRGQIDQIETVLAPDGAQTPPASDDETVVHETDVQLGGGGNRTTKPRVPGRASRFVVIANMTAQGELRVHGLDENGDRVVTRSSSQNPDYAAAAGGGQIFVDVRAFTSKPEFEFVDTSGGTNTLDYIVRVV